MRIIHVITRLVKGGADENTIITCNLQTIMGHEVWLVYGRDAQSDMLALLNRKVRVVQEPALVREISAAKDFKALLAIHRLLLDLRPEVLHTHTSKAGVIGRLAARWARVPIVLHGVHILPFLNVNLARRLTYQLLERLVAPATDAYIAVSHGMRDANIAARLGTSRNNFVVYSGMDLSTFEDATATEDAPPGRLIVLAAAFEERKRHSAFLDVFAALHRRHPNIRLCLLGEGEGEAALRQRVAELGLTESVHFLGFRHDLARWIAAAEICVLPSMREGLPRVVVQYVAVGKPVVVTALPGIEEVVDDGENGLVVHTCQVEDMEAPIERLLTDPSLAARLAVAAKARDVSRWSSITMVRSIEGIVRKLAAEKGVLLRDKATIGKRPVITPAE